MRLICCLLLFSLSACGQGDVQNGASSESIIANAASDLDQRANEDVNATIAKIVVDAATQGTANDQADLNKPK
jgi:hypothetical protein